MSNFDGKIYYNLGNKDGFNKTFWDIIKWQFLRKRGEWPEEEVKNKFQNHEVIEKVDGIKITFINHASYLIQTQNFNILIDPVYSEKIGFSFWGNTIGPSRVRAPSIDFDKLPHIDYVLITHNHFDHMDLPTLVRLSEKAMNEHLLTTFILPMRNSKYLDDVGIIDSELVKIKELNWFEKEIIKDDLIINSVPAQHWSKREFFDDNKALWSGYLIETKKTQIFIAGDTGLGEHFEAIKEKFPAIDIAILPIGSYKPEWFMSYQHMSPKDAIDAFNILKAKKLIPYHYGSFELADDSFDEAITEFKRIQIKESMQILEEGKGVFLD